MGRLTANQSKIADLLGIWPVRVPAVCQIQLEFNLAPTL